MGRNMLEGLRKFVSVTNERPNGMVEFMFAVGDPELCVELVMPRIAFDEFCRDNKVEHLDAIGSTAVGDAADFNWNMHDATHQRFR